MKALPRTLSLLLPITVWMVAGSLLSTQVDPKAQRQLENAGQLLNGVVLNEPVHRAIRRQLRARPRWVVVGNSFPNTNLLPRVLTEELGLPPRNIVRLSVANTVGAHWYAILKYHVFVDGYAPDVLVLHSDLRSALLTTPLSEGSYRTLTSLAPPNDPELSARIDASSSYAWQRLRDGGAQARGTVIHTIREQVAGLRYPNASKPLQRLNRATERVFQASERDVGRAKVTLPVVATGLATVELPSPERSFLGPIAALCAAHGTRLIMLRNPTAPGGERRDAVPTGTEEAVAALLDPYGGSLVQLSSDEMWKVHYHPNDDHMTKEGARRYSSLVGAALWDLGVHEAAGQLSRPASVSVEGPNHGGLRDSWVGLKRGDALTVEVGEPVGNRKTVPFTVVSVGPDLQLSVPSEVWRDGERSTHRGVLEGGAPWSVTLTATGPTVVRGIELGTGAPRTPVGYRPDLHGLQIDLLGRPEVLGAQIYRESVRPTWTTEVPHVPRSERQIRPGPGPTFTFNTRDLAYLNDLATEKITPYHARCSPVGVLEDGVLLGPHTGCEEVQSEARGRTCHGPGRVFFATPDGSDPRQNGHHYALGLRTDRSCDGGFWLYPHDEATLTVPAPRLQELSTGRTTLTLTGHSLGSSAPIRASVRADSIEIAHGSFSKSVTIPIDSLPTRGKIDILLRNPGEGFFLVHQVSLREELVPHTQDTHGSL